MRCSRRRRSSFNRRGWYLAHRLRLPLTTPWIYWSFVLYFVAAGCWLPVVWLQIRMRRLAEEAGVADVPLPARYFDLLKRWIALGVPALVALLIVFWLMVAKPV